MEAIVYISANFQNRARCEKDLKDNEHKSSQFSSGYARSRKTVRYSEQIMSADKYPGIFSYQMEVIVYISPGNFQNRARCEKDLKDNKHKSSQFSSSYARSR